MDPSGTYQLMVQASLLCPSVIAEHHQQGAKERDQSSIRFNNYFALLSRRAAERLSSRHRAADKMNDEGLKSVDMNLVSHQLSFCSQPPLFFFLFSLPVLPPSLCKNSSKLLKVEKGRCLDFVTCEMLRVVPESSYNGSTVSYNFPVTTNVFESQTRPPT